MKKSDTSKIEFEKAEKPEARRSVKKFDTSMIVYIGVLTAMEIVLNRFLSINAWNLKIGFSFVPVAIAGMLFGLLPAAIVAALGDFVGALVFPIGPYFPGFTATAVLTGLCFGIFLYNNRKTERIILSVLINEAVGGLLMNSFWISVLYSSPFKALVASRLVGQILPMAVLESVVLVLLFGKSMAVEQIKKNFAKQ